MIESCSSFLDTIQKHNRKDVYTLFFRNSISILKVFLSRIHVICITLLEIVEFGMVYSTLKTLICVEYAPFRNLLHNIRNYCIKDCDNWFYKIQTVTANSCLLYYYNCLISQVLEPVYPSTLF